MIELVTGQPYMRPRAVFGIETKTLTATMVIAVC
jgi:hypothetical protein